MVSALGMNRGSRTWVVWIALAAGVALVIVLMLAYRPATSPAAGSAVSDPTLAPYQHMVQSDLSAVLGAQSSHCDTVADTGCPAAVGRLLTPLQSWQEDLRSYQTPPAFVPVALQLRRHVSLVIADLDAIVAAVGRQNQAALVDSLNAAVGERDFIELEVGDLTSSRVGTTSDYQLAVKLADANVVACTSCVNTSPTCSGSTPPVCAGQIEATRMELEQFQGALVAVRAPVSLASLDSRLQGDLFSGDLALGSLEDAVAASNATEVEFATASYVQARTQLARDVSTVLKP